mgnify:CR=1 FL=1
MTNVNIGQKVNIRRLSSSQISSGSYIEELPASNSEVLTFMSSNDGTRRNDRMNVDWQKHSNVLNVKINLQAR